MKATPQEALRTTLREYLNSTIASSGGRVGLAQVELNAMRKLAQGDSRLNDKVKEELLQIYQQVSDDLHL